jgi:hypothetical protein
MDYATARPHIKSGDLLAFSHVGWGSWYAWKIQIVRMMTRSEFSHVAIAWVIGGRVFALEAVIPLVRIYPLSKLGDFYHLPLNTHWNWAEEFAMAHVGTPYSQLKAIRAFFKPVLHDGVTECAEYASDVLLMAGVDLGPIATPTAVVRAAQMQGSPCKLIVNQEK